MPGGRHDGRHPILIHNVLVGRHWDGSFLGSLLPWAELFDQWLSCDAAGDWVLGIHVQCWHGIHRSLATAMVIAQMAVALHADCFSWATWFSCLTRHCTVAYNSHSLPGEKGEEGSDSDGLSWSSSTECMTEEEDRAMAHAVSAAVLDGLA